MWEKLNWSYKISLVSFDEKKKNIEKEKFTIKPNQTMNRFFVKIRNAWIKWLNIFKNTWNMFSSYRPIVLLIFITAANNVMCAWPQLTIACHEGWLDCQIWFNVDLIPLKTRNFNVFICEHIWPIKIEWICPILLHNFWHFFHSHNFDKNSITVPLQLTNFSYHNSQSNWCFLCQISFQKIECGYRCNHKHRKIHKFFTHN